MNVTLLLRAVLHRDTMTKTKKQQVAVGWIVLHCRCSLASSIAVAMRSSSKHKCRQCVELLKEVLASDSSRLRTLLEAMDPDSTASSCDFVPINSGILVSFSKEKAPQVTLSSPKHESSSSTTIPQPVLAASPPGWADDSSSLKIECRPCASTGPEGGARAFVQGPTPLSIVLCSNRLRCKEGDAASFSEMQQVLTHELIHVYDVRLLKLDLKQCIHLAYSEIRAAREAECHESWFPSQCIQIRAEAATHNLFPSQAGECIEKAYNSAMADLRPFGNTHSER